jgi:hypothetical protein
LDWVGLDWVGLGWVGLDYDYDYDAESQARNLGALEQNEEQQLWKIWKN